MPRSPVRGRPSGRMSSDQVTAASTPWSFNGRNYELSPLTINDFGTVTEAMRSHVLRRFRDLIEPGADPLVTQSILENGYRLAGRFDILNLGKGSPVDQADLLSLMAQPIILTTILWSSLRHNHKHLTRFEVADWFRPEDMAALEEAVIEILRMAGITLETDNAPPPAAGPAPAAGSQEGQADAEGFRSGGAIPGDHADDRV